MFGILVSNKFISIHAPTRGATTLLYLNLFYRLFQSTLLQEERLAQPYVSSGLLYFNPRSYKRSDSESVDGNAEAMIFQSTLLQEERREQLGITQPQLAISIHAPTRGATFDYISKFASCEFQSTLLQEERQKGN